MKTAVTEILLVSFLVVSFLVPLAQGGEAYKTVLLKIDGIT